MPSRVCRAAVSRKYSLSFRGAFRVARPSRRLKRPTVALTLPPKSLSGLTVVTLRAPPTALRPNSDPCGPRSTSTRSRSTMSSNAPMERLRYTPSTYIATPGSLPIAKSIWPMPRIMSCAALPPLAPPMV